MRLEACEKISTDSVGLNANGSVSKWMRFHATDEGSTILLESRMLITVQAAGILNMGVNTEVGASSTIVHLMYGRCGKMFVMLGGLRACICGNAWARRGIRRKLDPHFRGCRRLRRPTAAGRALLSRTSRFHRGRWRSSASPRRSELRSEAQAYATSRALRTFVGALWESERRIRKSQH